MSAAPTRRTSIATAAVAVAIAASPAPAPAAVEIGPQRVTVATPGASAVIGRDPVRIAFEDGQGDTVLRQVPNGGPPPLVTPPTLDPEVGGGDALPGAPALYSPLAFTVGTDAPVLYPAWQWGGTLLTGLQAGVQYSAREVIAASPRGDGVRLEVATSDPGGRRLVVVVEPDRGATIHVTATVTPRTGVGVVADSFVAGRGEAFHGFGGRHNTTDQRGNSFYNWVEQQDVGAGPLQPVADLVPGGGGEHYQFPNGPASTYYVQPLFVSSRPYGFLLDQPELSRFRLAADREDAWNVSAAASTLDYVVAPGTAPRAIESLTSISGRHRKPPAWAAGTILDRLASPFTETAASYRAKVLADIRDIQRYGLPLDAYRIEGWALLERDFLRDVIHKLHSLDIRVLLYFRAFVGADPGATEAPTAFTEAIANRYVATTAAGTPYVFVSNFFGPAAMIDFSKPSAIAWWQDRIRGALDLGADGFMQDFGEQVQLDMHFANGETGETMHNRYPALFHRATRQVLDSYERNHPGRSLWFFTRAGYSGRPGAAAWESANFPGDATTDWSPAFGFAALGPDMLNRAVGGAPGYSTDIGGYFDFHTGPSPKELFIRWAEAAALTPYFRLHGSASAGTHTPWSYDDETVAIYNELSRLHLRARPLIMRLWDEFERTGMPMTRPLWLAFPGDPRAERQEHQWMLGDDVLVAPVFEEGARGRRAYLPPGCWRLRGAGPELEGGRAIGVRAPLGELPFFFRCGTRPFEP